MSRLQAAAARLAERMGDTAVAAEAVTYTRGRTSVPIAATRARNSYQQQAIADGRANLMVVPQDWLVRPEAIVLGGQQTNPQDGDRITDAAGVVYELAPRDGEPSWRKADPYGKLLRLRTVREG